MLNNSFFKTENSIPYLLLLCLMFFNKLRPDLFLPGGKILMHFTTLLLGVLLLIWFSVKKNFDNTQTKFLILFLILMIVQLPFVKNTGYSFTIVKSMAIYIFLPYLFVVQFLDSYYKINHYIRLFSVLGFFFAALGVFGSGKIAVPVIQDENDFCLLMNILIPFAVFLCIEADNIRLKIFYFSLFLLYLAGNIVSFSRGGFIGLVAVVFFLFLKSRRKIVHSTIALVIAVGVVFLAPPRYLEEIKTIDTQSHEKDTGAKRIESWKAGWRMFLDHPIIGVGALNFGVWHADYYDQDKNPQRMWGRVAHSLYFTLVPEMGIVGTFLFLGIAWHNYKNYRFIISLERRKNYFLASSRLSPEEKSKLSVCIRRLANFSSAFIGAFVAYFATGLFISILWYSYFWYLTAFLVATYNIALKAEILLLSNHVIRDDDEQENHV